MKRTEIITCLNDLLCLRTSDDSSRLGTPLVLDPVQPFFSIYDTAGVRKKLVMGLRVVQSTGNLLAYQFPVLAPLVLLYRGPDNRLYRSPADFQTEASGAAMEKEWGFCLGDQFVQLSRQMFFKVIFAITEHAEYRQDLASAGWSFGAGTFITTPLRVGQEGKETVEYGDNLKLVIPTL